MPRSRQDLIERVLKRLGLLAAGQAPSPEDANTVDAEINTVLDKIRAHAVVYVHPEEIDDELFLDVATIIAADIAEDFGIPISDQASLIERAKDSLESLKTITRRRPGPRNRLRVDPALMPRCR